MSAETDSNIKKIRMFVRLLDEGTDVSRPTEAIQTESGLFRILEMEGYDPQTEIWEFPPGSLVRGETRRDDSGEYLLAVKP